MLIDKSHNVTRKKNKPWLLIITVGIITISTPFVIIYGPDLYYQYAQANQFNLEQQSVDWAKTITSGKYDASALIKEISEAQKLTEIIINKTPLNGKARIQDATLVFYKMMIRMPVNDENLMQLTGRGYMPLSIPINNDTDPQSSIQSAKNILTITRRAIAIQPEVNDLIQTKLLLLYGDFIFTGRTDKHLLNKLNEIDGQKVPDHLRPWYEWIAISLYTLMGETLSAQKILKSIDNKDPANGQQNHLLFSEANQQLILCHSYFYNKQYLQALQLARLVKNNKMLSAHIRSEATRMEAEIFLIQRGKPSAIYFFQEALEILGDEDSFIKERLASIKD